MEPKKRKPTQFLTFTASWYESLGYGPREAVFLAAAHELSKAILATTCAVTRAKALKAREEEALRVCQEAQKALES